VEKKFQEIILKARCSVFQCRFIEQVFCPKLLKKNLAQIRLVFEKNAKKTRQFYVKFFYKI